MTTSTAWIAITLATTTILGLIFAAKSILNLKRMRDQKFSGEENVQIPMSPLQLLAWCGLGIGFIAVSGILYLFYVNGIAAYDTDDNMRIAVLGFIFGGLILYILVYLFTKFKLGISRTHMDERDKTIRNRASIYQANALLITIIAWAIYFTEAFRGTPGIPQYYPYLMFWSAYVVYFLSYAIGILIGYKRMDYYE